MSYAEHGPRIFLSSKLSNDISLIYGDSILPSICSESRLKLHYFSTNIRTWSPNALETSHYLRELNDHTALHTIPFNVIIESMIDFTSRATSELRKSRQELWKYKLLPLTREQKKYLENFIKQDELQKLNKHLQLLLKKEYKNTDVLKNNLNVR
ncbi:hypothetical protein X777_09853 [Ooceraea biroi]|uniref:Uncharacterized protein n=1 Tax=Ooceraea biroi TaxID=2015173 RepID=A0A026W498_OOCBI|nr:hypothetical protein X777_09853 [Ooceraea biroi]